MSKNATFTKPHINFPTFPAIFIWIKADYDKVKTYPEYASFIHRCLNFYDTSVNAVKRETYLKLASALYAADTNTSYESKNLEILANR